MKQETKTEKAIRVKNEALAETLRFLGHIQGRVGEMAFDQIYSTVEKALNVKP